MNNVDVTPRELMAMRVMSDFDLTMVISEINEHGWEKAREIIPLVLESDRETPDG